jgi:hypothetical protein
MGNATSQRNITVVNDNLVPVIESEKTGETLIVKVSQQQITFYFNTVQ